MSRKLNMSLVRYFARLENLDDKWKELAEKAERPLEALANQAEQLRHVTNVNINETENSVNGETQERLIFKILMGIEDEITLLLDILMQFNDNNQDLKNYLINLENARSQVSLKDETMQELIKGTSYRPKLNLLLEWAMEGFQFYNNMYLSIRDCMKSIDYKREETIDDLISSFVEDQRGRRNINKILAFTQFLALQGDSSLRR
ncbi:uncharacterized protein LOC126851501 [Cataglyphis hispanica]|uniref:uncharacterized protein LOC126851501 n=1 Tax=Cataglyphis hispanica TaxID=1086592 RepID=UPI0021801043|nr:uncharacterized protein LOC126851501 [Cataglyphis hispanica]